MNLPVLDVKSILKRSIDDKSLVLTIPWVTKYISMLDYTKLRLPQLLEVYEILFTIHHRTTLDIIPDPFFKNISKDILMRKDLLQVKQKLYSAILIKLCLGWLFELPHFPQGLYDEWCFREAIKSKNDVVKMLPFENSNGIMPSDRFKIYIDDLGIVDYNILRICCPYLEEIRNLLSSSSNVSNSASRVKHITPVTALSSPTESTTKKIQFQLEEAFFNGQPASVRKTVEFVSERIASACVKQICYKIVPDFKKKFLEELKFALDSKYSNSLEEENVERVLRSKANELSLIKFKELEDLIQDTVDKQIKDRIPPCIDFLLSFDALSQTKKLCAIISKRACRERIKEWRNAHVTIEIITKDFDSIIKSIMCGNREKEKKDKLTFVCPIEGRHNENALSPAAALEFIRNFIWNTMERSSSITVESVHNVIHTTLETLQNRCDINKSSYHCINQLIIDSTLNLITYRPDMMDKKLLDSEVVRYFKELHCNTDDFFKNIICPRNVMLLAQSPDSQKSWETLALFVALLLKEKLLMSETFEMQSLEMYKHTWDQASLKMLSNFCQQVGDYCKEFGGEADKFVYLMGFLSDYCVDLDDLQLDISESC